MIGGEEEEFVTVSQEIKSRKLEPAFFFVKNFQQRELKLKNHPQLSNYSR